MRQKLKKALALVLVLILLPAIATQILYAEAGSSRIAGNLKPSGFNASGKQAIPVPVQASMLAYEEAASSIKIPTPFSTVTANGYVSGANSAPWQLYDNGTLVVSEGFINNNANTSPWAVHAANITNIVFDGPITAGASLRALFHGLSNAASITGLEYFDTSNVTDMRSVFSGLSNVTTLNISGWDTSQVRSMDNMFFNASSLISLDLSNWDVSNVTRMPTMFRGTDNLIALNVSGWDTGNVTSMSSMFYDAISLTTVDTADWDTSRVTNMTHMFRGATALTTLDVSNWDTGNVVTMNTMFYNTENLTSLDVSNWNTGRVATMNRMFSGARSIASLDVSNWDTANVTDMNSVFRGLSVTDLDVSGWDTGNVTSMAGMFRDSEEITFLDVSNWNTSNVTIMLSMFHSASGLATLDVSGWDTSNVANMGSMFFDVYNLTNLDVSGWDTSRVTNMLGMFRNTASLTYLDVSNWDTSRVTNMVTMFFDASSLTTLDVSGWDVSQVTSFDRMFTNASALTALDVSNWQTGNVTNMRQLFWNASSIDALDVSGWDTSRVTDMSLMFRNVSVTELDVSGFNTGRVTDMNRMFNDAIGITYLDVSNWDTSNVIFIQNMFLDTTGLTTLDVSRWDVSRVTNMTNLFRNARSLTSLDFSSWNTRRVPNSAPIVMTDIFHLASSLSRVTFGPDFVSESGITRSFPAVPSNAMFTGQWQKITPPGGIARSSVQLMPIAGGGPYAPGTWVWQRNNGIALTVDGVYNFPTVAVGYQPIAPRAVTVANVGFEPVNLPLNISISGVNANDFTLVVNPLPAGQISVGGSWEDAFTIVPKDDLPPGAFTATITITGNNLNVESFTVTFTVLPDSIENAVITFADTVFNGNPQTPAFTVTLVGVTLVEGYDFEIVPNSWLNNTNARMYNAENPPQVTIRGIGDFKGDNSFATGNFTIRRRPVEVLRGSHNITRAYDGTNSSTGANATGNLSLQGLVPNDSSRVRVAWSGISNFGGADVGEYELTLIGLHLVSINNDDWHLNYDLSNVILTEIPGRITPVVFSPVPIKEYYVTIGQAKTVTIPLSELTPAPAGIMTIGNVENIALHNFTAGSIIATAAIIGSDLVITTRADKVYPDSETIFVRFDTQNFGNVDVNVVLISREPTLTLTPFEVTITDTNLSTSVAIGGTASGAVTLDTSDLPQGVTATVNGNAILVTGTRPAHGQSAIDDTFIVIVTRGIVTEELEVDVNLTPIPPTLTLTLDSVTINDTNLSASVGLGGTAMGTVTLDTSDLPQGVSATVNGNTVSVTGTRPAHGQSAINDTFIVTVTRDGVIEELEVVVNLTPIPPTLTLMPDSVTITDADLSASVGLGGTAMGTVTLDKSDLPQGVTATVNGNTISVTGTRPPHGQSAINDTFIVTVTRDGVDEELEVIVNLTPIAPTLTLSPSNVTITDTDLSASVALGGTAMGTVTLDTSALPQGVSVTVSSNTISVTGTRPAHGQSAIDDAFIVTVTRDGVMEELEVDVNLTPIPPTLTLAPDSVTISDTNLSASVAIGGTAMGTIALDTSELPQGVSATVSGSTISVTGMRPAHGQSAIDDIFIVTVTRDGVVEDLEVVVNLTPMPPTLTLTPDNVTITDTNLSASVALGGTAMATVTLDTSALPQGVSATVSSNTISVTGTRPAHGQSAIDDTFIVTVTRDGVMEELEVVVNLTPIPPTLTLTPDNVTITDTNLSASVSIGGTAMSTITLDTSDLPQGVSASVSGNTISVTGTRPAHGQSAIDDTFIVTVTRDGLMEELEVVVNLTPIPPTLTLTPDTVTITDTNLSASVAIGGTAMGTITLDKSDLPQGISATVSGNTISVTGTRPAHGQSAINDTFLVTVTRDGLMEELEVDVNLTPIPPTLTVTPDSVTITDTNLSASVSIGGTAMGTVTLDTSDLPQGVSATVSGSTISVIGTRPAHGQSAIDDTFMVSVARDGVTEELEVVVNLTPIPPTLILTPDIVTITDTNLSASVSIGGTAMGTVTLDTNSLPQGVSVTLSGNTISVTGTRPAHGQSAIIDTFIVIVTRDGITEDLEVVVNLTPIPPTLILTPDSVTINETNLSASVALSGTATGTVTLDTSALPQNVSATVSGNIITVTGSRLSQGQSAIDNTFIVTVTRDGVMEALEVVVYFAATGDLSPIITIINHPAAVTTVPYADICASISVMAVATQDAPLSFQWFINTSNSDSGGVAIPSETSSTLQIPDVLEVGEYYFYVVISAPGATSVTSNVAKVEVVTELLRAISVSPNYHIFPAAYLGYGVQSAHVATITNTGNSPTGFLEIMQTDSNFEISITNIEDIAVGGSTVFTIRPIAGLGVGTHNATVTIVGDGFFDSFTVSFTVRTVNIPAPNWLPPNIPPGQRPSQPSSNTVPKPPPSTEASSPYDIPPSEQLEREHHLAYMFGDENGNFRPHGYLTRAEAASLLARTQLLDFEHGIQRLPPDMKIFNSFEDVRPGHWFYYYIAWAYNAGLVQGFDGEFRPNDPITREELAAMIVRLSDTSSSIGSNTFPDVRDVSGWALSSVNIAYQQGLFVGDDNGNFRPRENITRAQAATVINRLLGRIDSWVSLDAAYVGNMGNIRRFPDVGDATWYFPTVIAATNDHDLTRCNAGDVDWMLILS